MQNKLRLRVILCLFKEKLHDCENRYAKIE